MKRKIKILALTRYGALGASSRMRTYQYLPFLAKEGIEVEVKSFFDDETLSKKYLTGKYQLKDVLKNYYKRILTLYDSKQFDLILIEKEALPWLPAFLELELLKDIPYILDYDDAWFHNYDMHRLKLVRRLLGSRLDKLMAKATLVIGGNRYLAERAKSANANWIEVLPTVIDLERYPQKNPKTKPEIVTIVWIGSPSTVKYLETIKEPLQQLAKKIEYKLRVIGAEFNLPDVQVECLPWSEATEVENIANADIGIMPLLDSPWERGKCGYKLIQYMACSLPVIASPIGVNNEIVEDGINGYLANNALQWLEQLESLLLDANLRQQMGLKGREKVEQNYSLQVTAPKLAIWLKEAALGN